MLFLLVPKPAGLLIQTGHSLKGGGLHSHSHRHGHEQYPKKIGWTCWLQPQAISQQMPTSICSIHFFEPTPETSGGKAILGIPSYLWSTKSDVLLTTIIGCTMINLTTIRSRLIDCITNYDLCVVHLSFMQPLNDQWAPSDQQRQSNRIWPMLDLQAIEA